MRAMLTPLDCWRAGFEIATMMAEAQIVISLRLLGIAGVWNTPEDEHRRMFSEKTAAAQEAGLAAARAFASGHKPADVARAAMTPLRRRTKANVKRLTRRGIKTQF